MKVKLTDDNKFLIVKEATKLELDQLKLSFTKEPAESWIIKKKNPFINLKRSFINDFNMIPIGLWYELILVCQKFNFQIEFEDDFTCRTQDCALTFNSFKEYIDELFKDCTNDKGVKMTPMHYQLEGVFKLLKFKKASIEVTTSGGKTLMAYCLFKFLKEVADIEKILYIVPNSQLATQSLEKFYLYDNWCGQEGSFKGKELHSGISAKEKKTILDTNILFGTFQSLCKKDAEFFKDFGTVIIDECLHPDSLISMEDGSLKPIKEIKEGEKVFTFNEETKEKEIHEVEYVYKNLSKNENMYELELEDGKILKLTGNHKVLLTSGIYKRVDELSEEDNILEY